jgi:electron transport complex protein RnfG
MRNLLFIIVSLTTITTVCGLALGAIYEGTKERIEEQVLINKQIPAVEKILTDAKNALLPDRRTLEVGQNKKAWRILFPGRREKGGEPYAVAFESSAAGYGGDIGVMVGFDLAEKFSVGPAYLLPL